MPVDRDQLVLLYTDGVTETAGPSERFGAERLRRLLSEHAGLTPGELLTRLDETLTDFRGGPADDDVAALALRPRPDSAGRHCGPAVDDDHPQQLAAVDRAPPRPRR